MNEIPPDGKSGLFKADKPANDPAKLGRAADALLFYSGSTRLAEHLAHRAAQLRESAR